MYHCKYNEKLNIVTSSLIIDILLNKTSLTEVIK